MNINEVLQTGREALLNNGIDPREARLLLAFVMKVKKEELIKYKECSEEIFKQFINLIEKRVSGEPYAYIVGYKEFMKLNFKVNSNVLIPREDTEILVQEIIDLVANNYFEKAENISSITDNINKDNATKQNYKIIKILDMCTGSGCIAISLAKYIKNSEVTAVDISENALKIAKENAIINDVKIDFIKSNLFENVLCKFEENMDDSNKKLKQNNIAKKFDIIVSNPPYIKKEVIETLQKEVKREPILALDGGKSGLEFYEKIIHQAKEYLNNNGILAFEIGFAQGEAVSKIMKENGFKDIVIKKDISENDRIVIGRIEKNHNKKGGAIKCLFLQI